jgi:uncharacterized phage-associated protein
VVEVTVHDIAALVIEEQHRAGRPIDKLQLQKLLYLVQGAHIALAGTTAFRASFKAYANGPVIEEVESSYRNVTTGRDPLPGPVGGDPSKVDPDVAETVHEVLRLFGGWEGPNLERFVKKKGAPWRIARGDLPAGAQSRNEISLRDITEWFVTHRVDPNDKAVTPPADSPVFDDIDSMLADLG